MFVRVRGDTSDVTRQMKGVERSLLGVERSATNMGGGLKKAENALANYISRSVGANAVTRELSLAMSGFTLGGGVTSGVLLGIGAIIAIYEKFTESARKAKEEQQRLTGALAARFAPRTGPRSEANKEFQAALQTRADLTRQIGVLEENGQFFPGQIAGLRKQLAEVQQAIDDAYAGSITKMDTVTVTATRGAAKIKDSFNDLRDAAAKVNAEILQTNKDWWRNYIDRTEEALTLTEQLNREIMAARPSLLEVFKGATTVPTGPVDISDSVKIANDQAKKINDAAAEHSEMLKSAIWGSAAQLANSIVSALNFGGGGRGSNVGGSIGSTIGFGIGFAATSFFGGGPVGGAIGSLIGNIGGSLIGGLFDHKKAVDNNTAAVRQNTAALLLNSPSGYKTAGNRFNATDIKDFRNASLRYNTRGGAPILVTP